MIWYSMVIKLTGVIVLTQQAKDQLHQMEITPGEPTDGNRVGTTTETFSHNRVSSCRLKYRLLFTFSESVPYVLVDKHPDFDFEFCFAKH